MAVDVDILSVASGYNLSKINTNLVAIQTALQDALGRSGDTPNHMMTTLDMDGEKIINVGTISADAINLGGASLIGEGVSTSSLTTDKFTSAGGTGPYTLSTSPLSVDNMLVYINGVVQHKDTYTINGTSFSTDSATTPGDLIEVSTYEVVPSGAVLASATTIVDVDNKLVGGNVEVALQELAPFPTVALMVASTDLSVGMRVRVLEYFAGTGGGGMGEVKSTGTADGFEVIALAGGLFWHRIFDSDANIDQTGALSDDTTDSLAEWKETYGRTINVGKGSYKIIPTTPVVPTSDTKWVGEKGARVHLDSSTTTVKTDFSLANADVTIEGLEFEHDGPAAEDAFMFDLAASGLRIKDNEIHGNNVSGNNVVQALRLHDDNIANVRISGNEFHNLQRVMIRVNSATGNLDNFWFENNYVHDLGQGGMQLNFPLGNVSGVGITSNYFKDFHSGTERIFTGGASIKQAVYSQNIFDGSAKNAVHLEEESADVVVASNIIGMTADASNLGHGIFLSSNNVKDGTYRGPNRIVINGNTLSNKGSRLSSTGITAVDSPDDVSAFNNSVMTNNVINNYDLGIRAGLGSHIIANNVIEACNTGMRLDSPGPDVRDNVIKNCTTGFSIASNGGLLGKNTFENVGTPVDTDGNERCSMSGFRIHRDTDISVPTGISTHSIGFPMGSEFFGSMKMSFYATSTVYQHRISEWKYDGTTPTDTEQQRAGSGAVAVTGFVDNAGNMGLRLNNTTGGVVTIKSWSFEFDGLWTSSS